MGETEGEGEEGGARSSRWQRAREGGGHAGGARRGVVDIVFLGIVRVARLTVRQLAAGNVRRRHWWRAPWKLWMAWKVNAEGREGEEREAEAEGEAKTWLWRV